MNKYYYNGPVLEFEKIIAEHWNATTIAVSENKARSNLAHQFKIQHGKEPNSKITVPGKLILVKGDKINNG